MSHVLSLDPEFLDQLTALVDTSNAAYEATSLTGQRKWMYPPLQGWNGDPNDITDANKAFIRDNLNQTYKDIIDNISNDGTIGESMVVKLQVDYIAALERAFRTRYCSSVRARVHAAARRRSQGSSAGAFSSTIVTWLEQLIFAAHDDPYEGVAPGDPPNV